MRRLWLLHPGCVGSWHVPGCWLQWVSEIHGCCSLSYRQRHEIDRGGDGWWGRGCCNVCLTLQGHLSHCPPAQLCLSGPPSSSPCSRLLHMLFPPPGTPFLHLSIWLMPTHPGSCYFLQEAFLGFPQHISSDFPPTAHPTHPCSCTFTEHPLRADRYGGTESGCEQDNPWPRGLTYQWNK